MSIEVFVVLIAIVVVSFVVPMALARILMAKFGRRFMIVLAGLWLIGAAVVVWGALYSPGYEPVAYFFAGLFIGVPSAIGGGIGYYLGHRKLKNDRTI